jgi:hypothetical protein
MSRVKSTVASPEALRRAFAAFCAMLVLALTVFAASPIAHGLLHDDETQPTADDSCAVMLFASGVSLPLGTVVVVAPAGLPEDVSTGPATEIFFVSPRYLHQPERGPPASLLS